MSSNSNRQLRLKRERRQSFFWTALLVVGILVTVTFASLQAAQDYLLSRRQEQIVSKYDHSDTKKVFQNYVSRVYRQPKAATSVDLFKSTGDETSTTDKHSVDVAHATLNPVATLSIPALKEVLPIYGNDSDLSLEYGAGYVPKTGSLFGGKGQNAAIAGHSGKSSGRLFTGLLDKTKIKIGVKFFIRINGSIHAYQIDQLKVVDPNKFKSLRTDPTKDYVTLITCYPLYSYSNRMLVRGHRIKYVPKENTGESGGLTPLGKLILTILESLCAVIVLLVFIKYVLVRFVVYLVKRRRKSCKEKRM